MLCNLLHLAGELLTAEHIAVKPHPLTKHLHIFSLGNQPQGFTRELSSVIHEFIATVDKGR
jgi:hypothetical protein